MTRRSSFDVKVSHGIDSEDVTFDIVSHISGKYDATASVIVT